MIKTYNMKNETHDDFQILSLGGGSGVKRIVEKTETIHINLTDSGITSIDNHIEQIEAIRHSQPNDIVVIFLSSCPGGHLSTTQSFINAIKSTDAHVLGVLEGENASAATMIAVQCDDLIVTPHSSMMVHCASGGTFGTITNMERNASFSAKWIDGFIRDVYKDFLSEDEFVDINKGLNIYLSDEEVSERWKRKTTPQVEEDVQPAKKVVKRGKKTT